MFQWRQRSEEGVEVVVVWGVDDVMRQCGRYSDLT